MGDFDHLAKEIENKDKRWTQDDIDEYFIIAGKEELVCDMTGDIYGGNKNHGIIFFESDSERIAYENGITTPKDFLKYEADLRGFLGYVDMVASNPDYTHPFEGMKELANTNADVCDRIDEIGRYFGAGGTFHKDKLGMIQRDLEAKLEVLQGPIRKMGKLIRG